MRKLKPNFITLHYGWIITCALMAFPVLYPYGNLEAVDAFFFGASGSTESGLNTVDVKDLKTYQQVYIYVIPTITNMIFISIAVVVVRLYWFHRRLGSFMHTYDRRDEEGRRVKGSLEEQQDAEGGDVEPRPTRFSNGPAQQSADQESAVTSVLEETSLNLPFGRQTTITFDGRVDEPYLLRQEVDGQTLHIPGPRQRDAGHPLIEISTANRRRRSSDDMDAIRPALQRTSSALSSMSGLSRRRPRKLSANQPGLMTTRSLERAATSILALGHTPPPAPPKHRASNTITQPKALVLPQLNHQVTIGRNSQFYNLTSIDREVLGGIEYRALKLLLKFIVGYFFGLHLLGVVCLLPWIHNAPQKYLDWLDECGIGRTWWAFYSAQTMGNNLGFTLTPDSMATFKDATWPMLCMTFMAFAGHTFYPVFLRLVLWTTSKLVSKDSAIKEDLRFLLDHPRRCYILLFPSKPTWILAGVLFILNFVDVLLIIVLDLNNPAVNDLTMAPRILSALFQAASSRHCGTSTLSLASVNPAVQFSLLVMMYIAIFPIAISVRASNTYEEKSLGLYEAEQNPDESDPKTYVMSHIRNQLSFDLWYIFLGTFIICIAEAGRIMDESEPAFSVFAVIFECVSA
ncbi:unnamed protein product [Clonostachys chloroleuca]|uniref:Low-affinity potassium transport protein n=1 Tax=Clonostachys chloroleuca TaxID=1926264 RepID=A0AA35M2J6_9HYPO|nr:unnamed protein product [Clonostachys chloroleuca]CAI6089202.1 unnamed protein product [Clonostachys chloroleuca]CAI6091511.1 unnamed protein product [Clonostachys chloroleuca]